MVDFRAAAAGVRAGVSPTNVKTAALSFPTRNNNVFQKYFKFSSNKAKTLSPARQKSS